jgi:hypothetical protein
MKSIGLQPSSTGMVGRKETGQKMSDYVIPNGPFADAFSKLARTGWRMNLQSAHRAGPKGGTTKNKATFVCPACGANAWGKPWVADRLCHLRERGNARETNHSIVRSSRRVTRRRKLLSERGRHDC